MMGRLCPEMACGDWKEVLQEIISIGSGAMLGFTCDLQPEDRATVLASQIRKKIND